MELNVSVSSSPPGPIYQAASPVNLTCEPVGFFLSPIQSAAWNSTCGGSCFVLGQSEPVISREAIRAADAGVHSCTITDALGNRGTGEIRVNVSGESEYTESVLSIICCRYITVSASRYSDCALKH